MLMVKNGIIRNSKLKRGKGVLTVIGTVTPLEIFVLGHLI